MPTNSATFSALRIGSLCLGLAFAIDTVDADEFSEQISPLINTYCLDCHNSDNMESGIRVDHLNGQFENKTPFLWAKIREQVGGQHMPPKDEPQPTAKEHEIFTRWIDEALLIAKRRPRPKNGGARRLTVTQYQNTLHELLGIKEDFTSLLPPDAVSKDGFLNRAQTMVMSPLLVEAYFDVASKALDRCIVDPFSPPTIHSVRMEFGRAVNPVPYPDPLNLGPNNRLLRNEDFLVTQPRPEKSFDFFPFARQTRFRVIEGYQGNATVRGWKTFDSIYHAVYACMRGERGYPKGEAYSVAPEGLLLRPAIPNLGQFGVSTTYGPKANFKVSLRELPKQGNLRVAVTAARYNDGLLIDKKTPRQHEDNVSHVVDFTDSAEGNVTLEQAGIYQIDFAHTNGSEDTLLRLTLNARHFSGRLDNQNEATSFVVLRLDAGPLRVTAKLGNNAKLRRANFTLLKEKDDLAKQFLSFENRVPTLGAYLGLRRDCGSSQSPFDKKQIVRSGKFEQYVFEDAITNHPSPEVEADNVNYLAGLREVGIRSEYTDGRDMPRVLIQSVQIEGPYYESWPPKTHGEIFVGLQGRNATRRAEEIIRAFATRAFRRPVSPEELAAFLQIWEQSFAQTQDFHSSVKDALIVVLSSPQFLFLIEHSTGPQAEPLDEFELASKLAYFLWNGPPDEELLHLAENSKLRDSLDESVLRMFGDKRFERFTSEFATQWLSLDKLDVVAFDRQRHPRLTHEAKTELKKEPVELLQYLLRENRPIREFLQSDFILANEVVADYYGIEDSPETGLEFIPVKHVKEHLGGVLSQAAILAGLSDGREANPVKRGAWLARKIIAEPPDAPPPNVPELAEDANHQLSLRERLEQHRVQAGCVKCHEGIDPWGLPLEEYDAGGLFQRDADASSTLPDATNVQNANALKRYLATERIDQVAFSFLKHIATYATGRDLSYNEIEFLRETGLELRTKGYRMRDMVQLVVNSPLFLEK